MVGCAHLHPLWSSKHSVELEASPSASDTAALPPAFHCTTPRGTVHIKLCVFVCVFPRRHFIYFYQFLKRWKGGQWRLDLFTVLSFLRYDSRGHFFIKLGSSSQDFCHFPGTPLPLALSSCSHQTCSFSLSLHGETLCFILPDSYQTSYSPTLASSHVAWLLLPFSLMWSSSFYFLGLFFFRLSKEITFLFFVI